MTTENISNRALKIPRQLFFGAFAFLAANICIIVLNMDKFLIASGYTLACALCYLSCCWGYTASKVISAFLLLVTIILNFVDTPNLSIPIYQICIASLGAFFAIVSYFYLFCRTTKQWFNARQSNRRNARLEKRVQKLPKYTEKDYQHLVEIQKNIPPSYRWGKWVVLVVTVVEILGLFNSSIHAIYHPDLFVLLFAGSMIIGTIGLFRLSHSLIEIQATALVIGFADACLFFTATFLGALVHHKLHPVLIYHFFTTPSQEKINFVIAAPFFMMYYYIFFNKKSRGWLKAKRVTKGMMLAQKI